MQLQNNSFNMHVQHLPTEKAVHLLLSFLLFITEKSGCVDENWFRLTKHLLLTGLCFQACIIASWLQ